LKIYSKIIVFLLIYSIGYSQPIKPYISNIRINNNLTFDTFDIKFDLLVLKGIDTFKQRDVKLGEFIFLLNKDTLTYTQKNLILEKPTFRSGNDNLIRYTPNKGTYKVVGDFRVTMNAYIDRNVFQKIDATVDLKQYAGFAATGGFFVFKGLKKYNKIKSNYNIYLENTDPNDPPYIDSEYAKDPGSGKLSQRQGFYRKSVFIPKRGAILQIVGGAFLALALPVNHYILKWVYKEKLSEGLSFKILPNSIPGSSIGFNLTTKYTF